MPPGPRRLLDRMFGLDYRSLALFRVALAGLLLFDLYWSARNLEAFYTDDGVLPRSLIWAAQAPLNTPCPHLWSGAFAWQAALFGAEAVAGLLMLLGYRTRWATFAACFLLLSRQTRAPVVLYGADMLLRLAMFWAVFLPLGRRFALDAAWGRAPPPERPNFLGFSGVALIAQVIMMYFFSGLLKTGEAWRETHTAVTAALALDVYGRHFGLWLSQFHELNRTLTWMTIYIELYCPWLFVLPVGSAWGRLAGFFIFAGLQLGFNVCMQLGTFGLLAVVFTLPLLPAVAWERALSPLGRWLGALAGADAWEARWRRWRAARPAARAGPFPPGWRRAAGRVVVGAREGLALFLMIYVAAWNWSSLPYGRWIFPDRWEALGYRTGLCQLFNLFAPHPLNDDGWFVLRGWRADGTTVNLLSGAAPATLDRPPLVADTYGDECWAGYLPYLMYPESAPLLEPCAVYLAEQWRRAHPDEPPLAAVEIILMYQYVDETGYKYPVEPSVLWTQTFE